MAQSKLTTRAVIIDTDGEVDDALAIIMALKAPQLDLKAVTVVAGNIDVDQAKKNVYRVFDVVRPTTVPMVSKDCQKPLQRPLLNAAGIHGADGLGELNRFIELGGSPRYPALQSGPVGSDAVETLLEGAREFGQDLTVIALGPLTNIATAIQRDRTTMMSIGRLVIMGGAVTVLTTSKFTFF